MLPAGRKTRRTSSTWSTLSAIVQRLSMGSMETRTTMMMVSRIRWLGKCRWAREWRERQQLRLLLLHDGQ